MITNRTKQTTKKHKIKQLTFFLKTELAKKRAKCVFEKQNFFAQLTLHEYDIIWHMDGNHKLK